jgi:hypothetical protein
MAFTVAGKAVKAKGPKRRVERYWFLDVDMYKKLNSLLTGSAHKGLALNAWVKKKMTSDAPTGRFLSRTVLLKAFLERSEFLLGSGNALRGSNERLGILCG